MNKCRKKIYSLVDIFSRYMKNEFDVNDIHIHFHVTLNSLTLYKMSRIFLTTCFSKKWVRQIEFYFFSLFCHFFPLKLISIKLADFFPLKFSIMINIWFHAFCIKNEKYTCDYFLLVIRFKGHIEFYISFFLNCYFFLFTTFCYFFFSFCSLIDLVIFLVIDAFYYHYYDDTA